MKLARMVLCLVAILTIVFFPLIEKDPAVSVSNIAATWMIVSAMWVARLWHRPGSEHLLNVSKGFWLACLGWITAGILITGNASVFQLMVGLVVSVLGFYALYEKP